jgi:hypothetical protein
MRLLWEQGVATCLTDTVEWPTCCTYGVYPCKRLDCVSVRSAEWVQPFLQLSRSTSYQLSTTRLSATTVGWEELCLFNSWFTQNSLLIAYQQGLGWYLIPSLINKDCSVILDHMISFNVSSHYLVLCYVQDNSFQWHELRCRLLRSFLIS